MLSPGSCSRCSRPLPVESDGGLCPECVRTAGSAGSTPASAAQHPHTPATPPAPGGPATLSAGRPAAAPAGHPFAAQFQTTFTEADRTRTPHPDGDTGGFAVGTRDYLPEAPPGYDLVRPLGSGGWSTVYLAREHAAEGMVAIKFLHAPTSPIAFDRFLVEARALRQLDHPNIVRVFAVETHWREPFLTMEYAAGGTLADLARPGGPLPDPADAARLMVPVAEAVAAAHAAGILHRDLKPSNVLLSAKSESRSPKPEKEGACGLRSDFAFRVSDFSPKVSDFGLAKRTDRDDGLTRTGPLGTPSYMSPEAAAGRFREVGPAADVYGLGATLYHLLTGRPPFTGESSDEVIRKVLTEPPDRPRAVRPGIPAELEAVVVKALEKDPAARYATATELADDLRRFLAGQAPAAPVLSRRRRLRRWLGRNRKRIGVAVGVVLLAVGLVAAGRSFKSDPPPPPDPEQEIRAELAAGRPVTLIGETGLPKYRRFWLETAALHQEPDGACSFRAFDVALLELAPDLGLDHYEVRLELRHLPLPQAAGSAVDAIGFYFGHAAAAAGDGTAAHALFAVTYKDYEPPPAAAPRPRTRSADLMTVGYVQAPNARTEQAGSVKFAARPFRPKAERSDPLWAEPGDWRPIVVEVSPAEVHIRWRADKDKPTDPDTIVTLARRPGDELRRRYEELKAAVDRKAPPLGTVLPGWSPRMGFGVMARRAAVAVRNVTVTPLP